MYVASGCGDVSYHWSVPGGWIVISGQSAETLRVIPAAIDGVVSVKPCNQYGCGAEVTVSVVADSCSSFCMAIGEVNSDAGYFVVATADGGFAVAGFLSMTNEVMYLAKMDVAGNVQWSRTYGIPGSTVLGYSLTSTKDGGYVMTGLTNTSIGQGSDDVYVVRVDSTGNLLWTRTVGGSGFDHRYAVTQTKDGGFVIVGSTTSFCVTGCPLYPDVYVVKLDSAGNVQWTRTVGGANYEDGWAVVETSDGGIVIAGTSNSTFGFGSADMYVVKLDSSGSLAWTKVIGGSGAE